ncbi:MAG: hypothetical protein N3B16_04380 [Candidatus Aminicenantes bacterium]|nr:hypothetical protein [Candidatus Aminicenantes bacterium]
MSHYEVTGLTSKYRYYDHEIFPYENSDKKSFSKNRLAWLATAEVHYFFREHFSLGFGAEYRFTPIRNLIESLMPVNEFRDLILINSYNL